MCFPELRDGAEELKPPPPPTADHVTTSRRAGATSCCVGKFFWLIIFLCPGSTRHRLFFFPQPAGKPLLLFLVSLQWVCHKIVSRHFLTIHFFHLELVLHSVITRLLLLLHSSESCLCINNCLAPLFCKLETIYSVCDHPLKYLSAYLFKNEIAAVKRL